MKVTRLIICAVLVFGCAWAATAGAGERVDLKGRDTNVEENRARGVMIQTTQLGQGLPALTATDMCKTLLGGPPPGVTVVGTFAGVPRAGGTFTDALPRQNTGLSHGALVSSGNISTAEDSGPPWNAVRNTTWVNWPQPGDADVTAITGRPTLDRAALTCEVTSTNYRWLAFKYVFGSEEYDEWVNSAFNDGFGIWVDGRNVAVMPGWWPSWRPWRPAVMPSWPWWPGWWGWWWWSTPVTVNTVNLGGIGWNALHYISNDCNTLGLGYPCNGTRGTELDGLVQWWGRVGMAWPFFPPGASTWPAYPIRSRSSLLLPGVMRTVKFAIADASDRYYDSVAMARGYATRGFCWICPFGEQEAECNYELEDTEEDTPCEDAGGTWYPDPTPGDDVPWLCTDFCPSCADGEKGACKMVTLVGPPDDPEDPVEPQPADFLCVETVAEVCWQSNGIFNGVGTTCLDTFGSCCVENATCVDEVSEDMCTAMSGSFTSGAICGDVGSCEMPGGSCVTTTEDCCSGIWTDDGLGCPVQGACCTGDSCGSATPDTCTGTFMGPGTVCSEGSCETDHIIPAITEWGMAVMTLLLLSAATVVLVRRRAATA